MKKEQLETTTILSKINLLFGDYTLALTDTEKDTILCIIEKYLNVLNDDKLTYLYHQLCESNGDKNNQDLYIEIFQDLLIDCINNEEV